jgi:hypothetical protein
MSELQPVYPFGPPGSQIELYTGPIGVDSDDQLRGRIYVDLAGDLAVRWELIGADKVHGCLKRIPSWCATP